MFLPNMTSEDDPSGTFVTCHSQYAASCSILTPANASPLPDTTQGSSISIVGADIARETERLLPAGGLLVFDVISASRRADLFLRQEQQQPMVLCGGVDTAQGEVLAFI